MSGLTNNVGFSFNGLTNLTSGNFDSITLGGTTITAPITVARDILQERAAKKQLEESLKPGAGVKLKDIGK